MKIAIKILILLMLFSCSTKKQPQDSPTESKCNSAIVFFEQEFLSFCPISKGPEEVKKYLENLPGYFRNKEFDHGNGSVRFNAKNASIYGHPVLDDKSMFLLNYTLNVDGYQSWSLFQAIYFFEKKEDMDVVLKKMQSALNEKLYVGKEVKYTIANEAYGRFYLPCGSGFNFKQAVVDSKFVIDILWVRDITK